MTYADLLREVFPDLNLGVDDLILLEAHQIAGLPERAPAPELAVVLDAHPRLHRFFIARYPPIERFLTKLLAEHGPIETKDLAACEQALLWEIADWIVYQRAPESYDSGSKVDWDVAAVTEIVALDGKVVIDAGAGTGRVAFDVAPTARHVFAVEPVATLRQVYARQGRQVGDRQPVCAGWFPARHPPPGQECRRAPHLPSDRLEPARGAAGDRAGGETGWIRNAPIRDSPCRPARQSATPAAGSARLSTRHLPERADSHPHVLETDRRPSPDYARRAVAHY